MLTISLIITFAVVTRYANLFTSVSLIRTVAIIAVGGSIILLIDFDYITNYHNINNFFSGDILSISIIILIIFNTIICLSHWNSFINANKTPIALGILIIFTITGSIFLIAANNLITLIIALELQGFAVYTIASIYRWRKDATAAGLIYFILSALSSTLLILGISYIFIETGEISFNNIKAICINIDNNSITVGICLITVGALFKITAAPFHFWGPDVYDGVPTNITIWIAIIPKFAVIVFLARISSLIISNSWSSIVLICALVSFGIGSIVGLAQIRIKRLLAYSTITHVGFILVALVVGIANGIGSYGYYITQYGIVSILSFLVIIAIGNSFVISNNNNNNFNFDNIDIVFISSFSGIWNCVKILAVIFAIALYSSAGIPPLIGFYAKWSVIISAVYSEQWILAICGLISSVASAGFYLSVVIYIFFNNFNNYSVNNNSKLIINKNNNILISIITIFIVAPILASILVIINLFIAPYRPIVSKKGTYECGLLARSEQTRSPYSIVFYLVAVLFLVFDLEVTLLWPLAVVLTTIGFYGYWIAVIFFLILTIGFVIELASGVLRFS